MSRSRVGNAAVAAVQSGLELAAAGARSCPFSCAVWWSPDQEGIYMGRSDVVLDSALIPIGLGSR